MASLTCHHLPVFNHFNSHRNTTTSVQTTAITSATVTKSPFVGQKLRRLPSVQPNPKLNTTHLCKCQLAQDFVPVASAGYAVLLLGGGLFAYNKSGSKGSLFGGLTGAALMGAAYYLMQATETKETGDALAFGASLLFAAIFGIRFASTRKVIPAGLLLVISISLTALTYSAYLQDKI
ncbi:protein FATTY ACID EXPORT 4, chloroplastic-like [Bidens hawaiensis]|uniref:protein FATTY ACID EXPORT 4, chloroplastic-like n=1 Tax=Bidens hawaiensis TaxID=980011 RepID=UPI00404AEC5B